MPNPAQTPLVIDTNVLLDWLVFADPATTALASAVSSGRARWIATPAMLAEFAAVLARPLGERWERARERALTLAVEVHCERWPEPAAQDQARLVCRDAADQKFIDLAIACGACTLLTRDRALLDLRRRAHPLGVRIVPPAEWPPRVAADAAER